MFKRHYHFKLFSYRRRCEKLCGVGHGQLWKCVYGTDTSFCINNHFGHSFYVFTCKAFECTVVRTTLCRKLGFQRSTYSQLVVACNGFAHGCSYSFLWPNKLFGFGCSAYCPPYIAHTKSSTPFTNNPINR